MGVNAMKAGMGVNAMKAGDRAARVLIVDDHPAVREGLGVWIARQPDLELCGEAAEVAQRWPCSTRRAPTWSSSTSRSRAAMGST